MPSVDLAAPADVSIVPVAAPETAERLRALAQENFQFVHRVLRRLLEQDAADDATQQTFMIAASKIDQILPGAERAWLFQTAVRVASHIRRTRGRRREVDEGEAVEVQDPEGHPEEAASQQERLRLLDYLLDRMEDDLREVFVLFELEGLSSTQIAPILGVPVGTVASRLRRAREQFHAEAKRLRSKLGIQGGGS